MKQIIYTLAIFCLLMSQISISEETISNNLTPVGKWKTIDDETHLPKSIIRIEEHNGILEGFIEKTFPKPGETSEPLCDKCVGEKKDKPIIGMKIMWDLKRHDEDEFSDGEILDPKNGKTYSCKIRISKDSKILTVRGFLGFSLLGRSQTWQKEE